MLRVLWESRLAGLAVALAGFASLVGLHAPNVLINQVPFEKSPAVLIDRAETFLSELGHPELPHSIFGFYADQDYLDYLERERPVADRWTPLSSGRPPAMRFYYRKSPEPLVPVDLLRSRPTASDPPMNVPEMIELELDWEGRLLELTAIPPEKAEDVHGGHATWETLFSMAELSPEALTETKPEWIPPTFADERRAWTGVIEGVSMRVEVASLEGSPVWFRVIGPWDRPRERETKVETGLELALSFFVTLVVVAILGFGAYIAYRNLKLGRADRARAQRLAAALFALNITAWLLMSEHYRNPGLELSHIMNGLVSSLFPSALLWMFYIALEPYVRRIWPFGLMGWTRLFSGHYRDPLVGRDLLAGAAAGSFMAMAAPVRDVASRLLEGGAPMPVANGLAGLLGFRYSVVTTINILLTSINNAFLVVLLFVLVWMVVRRAWLALGITAALLASMVLAQIGSASFAGFLYLSFIVGMGAFVLWRFGLLAMITALFFEMALRQSPFTLNLSAWYAAPTLVVLGTLSSITVFAFVSSRAGEPLFGRTLLPD